MKSSNQNIFNKVSYTTTNRKIKFKFSKTFDIQKAFKKNIKPIKKYSTYKIIQQLKNFQSTFNFQPTYLSNFIQIFRATMNGDVFHSDTFRRDTYFSCVKNSYISIMSNERPCTSITF